MSKDFQNGKIYCIRNNTTDDIYIGSTYQPLSKRMAFHRNSSKSTTKQHYKIYQEMNKLGIENFYIELVEGYPCENNDQLRAREGHFIREMGTLNGRIEGRSKKQFYQDNKEEIKERVRNFTKANKERISAYKKKYDENNKEAIAHNKAEYYQEHKQERAEYNKQYREQNKERIAQQRKEYREQNREKVVQQKKEYRERKREEINRRQRELYQERQQAKEEQDQ